MKKEILIGEVLMRNGNSLFVNTLQNRIVKFEAFDSDDSWDWYCKPVKITIEEISEIDIKKEIKNHEIR